MANDAAYTIKYNKTSYHIAGIEERSKGSDMSYALTACSALSRSQSRMATGQTYSDLRDALDNAEARARARGAKMCTKCRVAAEVTMTLGRD